MDFNATCFTKFQTHRATFRWKLSRFSVYLDKKKPAFPASGVTSNHFSCGGIYDCYLKADTYKPEPLSQLSMPQPVSMSLPVSMLQIQPVSMLQSVRPNPHRMASRSRIDPTASTAESSAALTSALTAPSHIRVSFISSSPIRSSDSLSYELSIERHAAASSTAVNNTLCISVDELTGPKRNEYLPDDVLTIVCEVTLHLLTNHSSQIWVRLEPSQAEDDKKSIQEDFQTLLETGEQSDVTLLVGEERKEIKTHKAILSARSPVFSAMFQHQMAENTTNCVKIEDAEFEVVQEMLMFIYTNQTPHLQDMARELLALSDKYCLQKLKIRCLREFQRALKQKNVVETLVLADRYNASELKASCLQFISCNVSQLGAGFLERHNDLQEKNPKLFSEVIKKLLSSISADAQSE